MFMQRPLPSDETAFVPHLGITHFEPGHQRVFAQNTSGSCSFNCSSSDIIVRQPGRGMSPILYTRMGRKEILECPSTCREK